MSNILRVAFRILVSCQNKSVNDNQEINKGIKEGLMDQLISNSRNSEFIIFRIWSIDWAFINKGFKEIFSNISQIKRFFLFINNRFLNLFPYIFDV